MRKIISIAGLGAAAALFLAACGGQSGFFAIPQSGDSTDLPTGSATGPTTLVRFVVVSPPGFGPVDIVDANDPKHKYATDLTAGTVTDYLRVPEQLEATDATGKPLDGFLSGMDDSAQRNTMIIGPDNNNGGAQYFKETNGQVGYDPEAMGGKLTPGKPIIVSVGGGILKGGPDSPHIELGQAQGKCVPGAIPSQQDGTIDQSEDASGSVPTFYAPTSGSLQLSWYGNPDCTLAETSSVDFTMQSGQFAYALPFLADSTHVRLLVVPVTSDKPGQYGVIDSPAGPAWTPDPCAVSMCVDGSAVPTTDDQSGDTDSSDPGN